MTNADRIRKMTDEELADFLYEITDHCSNEMACNQFCHDDYCPGYCGYETCEKWMKREVED